MKDLAKQAGIDWHKHWNDDETNKLDVFAKLVSDAERKRCCDLLEGLHEAQRGNANHNYYRYAANFLQKLK